MKRLLPIIPITLLFLVNSCGSTPGPTPTLSINDMWTAIALTQTAAAWVPPPTQTSNSDISNMVTLLNTDLSTASTLGWILDAQYYVINVTFLPIPNRSDRIARVDVDCICMNTTDCCSPERTFLVIVESMRKNNTKIPFHAFSGVGEFMVVCSNLKTKEPIGAISAPWQDIQNYFQNPAYGVHLGVKAVRTKVP